MKRKLKNRLGDFDWGFGHFFTDGGSPPFPNYGNPAFNKCLSAGE